MTRNINLISFNLKHNDPIDDTHHGTELSYEFLQY